MSKKRNRNRNTRDASAITAQRARFPSILLEDLSDIQSLTELSDLRTYNPVTSNLPPSFQQTTRVIPRPVKKSHYVGNNPSPFIGFNQPEKVLVCVRRKNRRKAMFASNKAGRGGQKRPRRNSNSNIWC